MSGLDMARAQRAIDACRLLATFSESPDNVTRTYLSPPVREVHRFLQGWMARLGMESRVDAVGNLRGLFRGGMPSARRLLIGSHIDTVPDAGAFDGVLGVVIALALVEALHESPGAGGLPYDIEVIAFSEEEGVRFGVPFIGSCALLGELDGPLLQRRDSNGVSIAQAIEAFGLNPGEMPNAAMHEDTFAFLEFHIEQGPVLESLDRSLGIVEAIVGQSRYQITFQGKANHAGTTPMHLRHDALAGAAEWMLGVEREAATVPGLVATVGSVAVAPGAANVIPGEVRMSLDIRHASDETRLQAEEALLLKAQQIAVVRKLSLDWVRQSQQPATSMESKLTQLLEDAAIAAGFRPHRMISGAGHDAMVMARVVPAAMLFLRSPGGISHHPDESVLPGDVEATLAAGLYFLKHL